MSKWKRSNNLKSSTDLCAMVLSIFPIVKSSERDKCYIAPPFFFLINDKI